MIHTIICDRTRQKPIFGVSDKARLKPISSATDTVKTVLSGHSKRRANNGFQDPLSLNVGQTYCRMLQKSILQLSLRALFCLFLSGRLRHVRLY